MYIYIYISLYLSLSIYIYIYTGFVGFNQTSRLALRNLVPRQTWKKGRGGP